MAELNGEIKGKAKNNQFQRKPVQRSKVFIHFYYCQGPQSAAG